MTIRRLFIASLGNPSPAYKNTLHSAGHTLLSFLREYLNYPAFGKSRPHANGLLSQGEEFTLWQSPSLMNTSGPAVATAWKAFLRDLPSEDRSAAKLVIVHDELESPLGKIKAKLGGSVKGHNGLKSCVTSLGGNAGFTKLGVGIGRPESRDSTAVSAYVLKKMGPVEMEKIKNAVDNCMDALVEIRDS